MRFASCSRAPGDSGVPPPASHLPALPRVTSPVLELWDGGRGELEEQLLVNYEPGMGEPQAPYRPPLSSCGVCDTFHHLRKKMITHCSLHLHDILYLIRIGLNWAFMLYGDVFKGADAEWECAAVTVEGRGTNPFCWGCPKPRG